MERRENEGEKRECPSGNIPINVFKVGLRDVVVGIELEIGGTRRNAA